MARLIDADEAKANIITFATECGSTILPIDGVLMILNQIDTVDAVEVVRCRECKHFRHYGKTSLFINGKNIKAGWCQRRISYDEEYRMTADDFCSYGERKDGGGNG